MFRASQEVRHFFRGCFRLARMLLRGVQSLASGIPNGVHVILLYLAAFVACIVWACVSPVLLPWAYDVQKERGISKDTAKGTYEEFAVRTVEMGFWTTALCVTIGTLSWIATRFT